jgi:hypothetical protein
MAAFYFFTGPTKLHFEAHLQELPVIVESKFEPLHVSS